MIESIKSVLSRIASILKTKADKSEIVQSDWAQTDINNKSFIRNKPVIQNRPRDFTYDYSRGFNSLDPEYWEVLKDVGNPQNIDIRISYDGHVSFRNTKNVYSEINIAFKPQLGSGEWGAFISRSGEEQRHDGGPLQIVGYNSDSHLDYNNATIFSHSSISIEGDTSPILCVTSANSPSRSKCRLAIKINLAPHKGVTFYYFRIYKMDPKDLLVDVHLLNEYERYFSTKPIPSGSDPNNYQHSNNLYVMDRDESIQLDLTRSRAENKRYSTYSYIIASPSGQITFTGATIAPDGNLLKGQGSSATIVTTPTQVILRISNV